MVILDNCPDLETSEFYALRAAHEGWTRPVLQTMIASRLRQDPGAHVQLLADRYGSSSCTHKQIKSDSMYS